MKDEVFRPQKPSLAEGAGFQIEGTKHGLPPEFVKMIEKEQQLQTAQVEQQSTEQPVQPQQPVQTEQQQPVQQPMQQVTPPVPDLRPAPPTEEYQQPNRPQARPPRMTNHGPVLASSAVQDLLDRLPGNSVNYEKISLPSRGRFYDGVLQSGVVHMRPMTGAEEEILATPRFVRKNEAMDMIFKNVIQEKIDPNALLSIDRTYLLVYLRIISYSNEYNVEINCPDTDNKFPTTIDLNSLEVDFCPDDFGPQDMHGVLPQSGFNFTYRLSTGSDEQKVQAHRERRIRMFGDQAADDSLTYRTALLIQDIEGVSGENDLKILLKRLPVGDLNHLRNLVNEPPFGIDTKIKFISPYSSNEFEQDLPLETSFFFPRSRKKERDQRD